MGRRRKTITELQSYLQNPNRDIRKKAKTIISEQFLSVEKELQSILNTLINIRHQKAKNIQVENYRDYMFKNMSVLIIQRKIAMN